MNDDLAARINRLEAESAIRALAARYCFAIDNHDLAAVEELFTADARVHSRDGVMDARGRDAVIAQFERRFAVLGPSNHVSHDHWIRFGDDPEHAEGTLTVTAGDPVIMLMEPVPATRRALERSGRRLEDIDLFEVNEAFASVPMAWLRELGADPAKLNVNGGAIALGHPLGASGAKLMATLVHSLRRSGKRFGLQTMCEGGGIANATIIEALN